VVKKYNIVKILQHAAIVTALLLVSFALGWLYALDSTSLPISITYTADKAGAFAININGRHVSSIGAPAASEKHEVTLRGVPAFFKGAGYVQIMMTSANLVLYTVALHAPGMDPVQYDLGNLTLAAGTSILQQPSSIAISLPANNWELIPLSGFGVVFPIGMTAAFITHLSIGFIVFFALLTGGYCICVSTGLVLRIPGEILVWATAFIIFAFITYSGWPGFMDGDGPHFLSQVRNAVKFDGYPPMVVYVWRIFDWIAPGQTLMWMCQNALFICSIAWLLIVSQWRAASACAMLAIFCLAPPVFGPILVVIKDIPAATFMILSVAVIVYYERVKRPRTFISLFILVSFLACAYRLDAIPRIIPLIFYICFLGIYAKKTCIKRIISSVVLIIPILIMWIIINFYQIPSFKQAPRNPASASIFFMQYDIFGIVKFSKDYSLVGDFLNDNIVLDGSAADGVIDAAYTPPSDWAVIYPKAAKIFNFNKLFDGEQLVPLWKKAVIKYPWAFLQHKIMFAREILGTHTHEIYYLTKAGIDENSLGIPYPSISLGQYAVINQLFRLTGTPLAKLYPYLVCFGLLALYLARRHKANPLWLCCIASAALNFAVHISIFSGAQARYSLWMLAAFFVAAVVAGRRNLDPADIGLSRHTYIESANKFICHVRLKRSGTW